MDIYKFMRLANFVENLFFLCHGLMQTRYLLIPGQRNKERIVLTKELQDDE